MGSFIATVHVRSSEPPAVETALGAIGVGAHRLLGPTSGWITVLEERLSDQDVDWLHALTQRLSAEIGTLCAGFLVHDSDFLVYAVFDRGVEVDTFHSWPGYFEDEEPEPEGGDGEALAPFCVAGTTAEDIDLLLAQDATFADDVLAQMAQRLGIDTGAALTDFRDDDDDMRPQSSLGAPSPGGDVGEQIGKVLERLSAAAGVHPGSASGPDLELMAAVELGDEAAVRAAVAEGASVDAVTLWAMPMPGLAGALGAQARAAVPKMPATPLALAVAARAQPMAELLVSLGADVCKEVPPLVGPPLHLAASSGQPDVVALLLRAGADPRQRRANGMTALQEVEMARAMMERFEPLKALLPPDALRWLPSASDFERCAALLREAGAL